MRATAAGGVKCYARLMLCNSRHPAEISLPNRCKSYFYSIACIEVTASMSATRNVGSGALTVRGLTPDLKVRLRLRAALNDRSMEAEARAILQSALAQPDEDAIDLATFARDLFVPLGGADLVLPTREPMREPPSLDDDALPIAGQSAEPARTSAPARSPASRVRRR